MTETYDKTKVVVLHTAEGFYGEETAITHEWPLHEDGFYWEFIQVVHYDKALPPSVGYEMHVLVGLYV